MNYFSLFLCLLLFSVSHLAAQQPKDRIRFDGNPINQPLVMVDSFRTDINYLIIDAKDIASIDILKDNRATERYGDNGKNGVLFIHPKKRGHFTTVAGFAGSFCLPGGSKKFTGMHQRGDR